MYDSMLDEIGSIRYIVQSELTYSSFNESPSLRSMCAICSNGNVFHDSLTLQDTLN